MNIAIIGSGGRLGAELAEALSPDHSVKGFSRQDLDLGRPQDIRRVLGSLDYDLAVVTGALTAVDYCEAHSQEAFLINEKGPEEIARVSHEKGAKTVYISTDFVFDGDKKSPYSEDDKPKPISVYGESKLRGEEAVLGVSEDNIVARVSWVYGPKRPAFPEWIIQQAKGNTPLSLPAEKTGVPSSTVDLSRLLQPLMLEQEDARGVYHVCNAGFCSWQEWGQACLDFAAEAGEELQVDTIGANNLSDISAFVAKRPVNSILDTGKYTELTGVQPRDWSVALREHLGQTVKKD